jgi:hypothetical protein
MIYVFSQTEHTNLNINKYCCITGTKINTKCCNSGQRNEGDHSSGNTSQSHLNTGPQAMLTLAQKIKTPFPVKWTSISCAVTFREAAYLNTFSS